MSTGPMTRDPMAGNPMTGDPMIRATPHQGEEATRV